MINATAAVRVLAAGLAAGVLAQGLLGLLFTSAPVRAILYDPQLQSALFIDITPGRDVPLSVAGLVAWTVVHAWLFHTLRAAIPGRDWVRQGLFWGFAVWLLYWVAQEWFIYHTLLGEPLWLNLLELALLLSGSLLEGLVIAFMLARPRRVAI